MTERRRVLVSGRVQGVFFREECRRRAESTGLTGWVRNLPDGRLEGCFEGDEEDVDMLVEWCRTGPSSAQVKDVEVLEEQPAGEERFSVR